MIDAPIGFQGDGWLIRIPGGPTFADIAIEALKHSAAARIPGPTSDVFYRLIAGLEEARIGLIPDPRLTKGGDRHVSMAHRSLDKHDDWGVKL